MSLQAAVGDVSESKLVIEIFYRPPDQKEQLDCEMTVQIKQACKKERVVGMEDFNYPGIDWNTLREGK